MKRALIGLLAFLLLPAVWLPGCTSGSTALLLSPVSQGALLEGVLLALGLTPGQMLQGNQVGTATVLPNGLVLIAGGADEAGLSLDTAFLYDPTTQTFRPTGTRMKVARARATATVLPSGQVLLVGGRSTTTPLTFTVTDTAEVYDPAEDRFMLVPATMSVERFNHTADLLDDGRVLVAGGSTSMGVGLDSAEIFDPATGLFTLVPGGMGTARSDHTSTLLEDGRVVLIGGDDGDILDTAVLYDANTNSFAPAAGTLTLGRAVHAAQRLPGGDVLVAGGVDPTGMVTATAERFQPATGTFVPAAPMGTPRMAFTLTPLGDGRLLVAGGSRLFLTESLATAEIFEAGAFAPLNDRMSVPRLHHRGVLLADGTVLLVAGTDLGSAFRNGDLFDPTTGMFSITGGLNRARISGTATRLVSGEVLLAGGGDALGRLDAAELVDPVTGRSRPTAGLMIQARVDHTAALLPSGAVLLAGGDAAGTAELYDPGTETFRASQDAAPGIPAGAVGVSLSDGRVLLCGGFDGAGDGVDTALLYDPATDDFQPTGPLQVARGQHSATLLADGTVLVVGGRTADDEDGALASAERYDPATGAFTLLAGQLTQERFNHTATLLPDGGLLVAGGQLQMNMETIVRTSLERFDPGTGGFETLPAQLGLGRTQHRALLTGPETVLFMGGMGFVTNPLDPNSTALLTTDSVEALDLPSGTIEARNPMADPRTRFTATLLGDGRLLAAGGHDRFNAPLNSSEWLEP